MLERQIKWLWRQFKGSSSAKGKKEFKAVGPTHYPILNLCVGLAAEIYWCENSVLGGKCMVSWLKVIIHTTGIKDMSSAKPSRRAGNAQGNEFFAVKVTEHWHRFHRESGSSAPLEILGSCLDTVLGTAGSGWPCSSRGLDHMSSRCPF